MLKVIAVVVAAAAAVVVVVELVRDMVVTGGSKAVY